MFDASVKIETPNFMIEFDERLKRLEAKLDALLKAQDSFRSETNQIRAELNSLRGVKTESPINEKPSTAQNEPPKNQKIFEKAATAEQGNEKPENFQPAAPAVKERSSLEKFVGENLISFIGIAVLLLGVAIGAKYAIDRDLISPLMRIVIGYVFGFVLLGFRLPAARKISQFQRGFIERRDGDNVFHHVFRLHALSI